MFFADRQQQLLIAAAVGRTGHRDHIPAVSLIIITVLNLAPDIERAKRLPVLLGYNIGFCRPLRPQLLPKLIIFVHAASIDFRHPCGIFRLFHPALDLEGIDAGLHQPGNMFDGTHILQTKQMPCCKFRSSLPHRIRQPARLGAPPPISAPPAQNAAEKTLSGIAVAHGPMDKALYFHP